jgi:CheY-like chemotaxis protein
MNASAPKKQAVEMPERALRVLVVEDSEESAQMAARLLRTAGHDVQTAHNGTEALVVAETFHPRVVLLDIGLPGLDGLHVARQLRRARPDVLLVAATGRSGPEAVRSSKEAGFDHHIVKPLDFGKLMELFAAHDAERDD